ncbi:MAG: SDR family oxidoreductase [Planctomycetota bacterium]
MSTTTDDLAVLRDPRDAYARPPFDQQTGIDMPGQTREMKPTPDHGEESYTGSGKLTGRVALITGADSGIGRAIALAYAREGADVVVTFLSERDDAEATADLVRDAGRSAEVVAADLRDHAAAQALFQRSLDRFGRLDVLVNNAAYQEMGADLDAMDPEAFDRIFKTNVYGPFWLTRAAMPHLPAGGSVVHTVSIQGYDPTAELLPYAATKSALISMTKSMAKLAIDQGVRVNAVAPGPVWTPLIPGSMPADAVESFGGSTVFGRPAQPAELAPLYVWLASDQASYVTGEVYGATGGKTPI